MVSKIPSRSPMTIIMMGLKTKNEFSNYKNILKMPGVYVHKRISPELSGYTFHSTPLNKKWIKSNYNFYKNDTIVKDLSGFVCTFPASMCHCLSRSRNNLHSSSSIQSWKMQYRIELHISWFFNFLSGNGKNVRFPGREKPGNREKSVLYRPPQENANWLKNVVLTKNCQFLSNFDETWSK